MNQTKKFHKPKLLFANVRGKALLFATTVTLLPLFAHAQTIGSLFDSLTLLFNGIISVLLGLALVAFFWGLVKFVAHAGDEKTHEEGRQLMIWGMIAIFVMVALWSILGFIQTELGLNFPPILGALPQQSSTIP